MQVRIRESSSADFEQLWRIDQQCFEPGIAYSRRELSWYMGQRGAFTFVAETRESSRSLWSISGFLVGQQLRRRLSHIVTIDILAEVRRAGIGKRLMAEAEVRFRELGADSVVLETAVDNEAAIRFYKRLGYTVVKTIPRYYLGKIDALMMMKPLNKI